MRVESTVKLADHEASIQEKFFGNLKVQCTCFLFSFYLVGFALRLALACGSFKLIYDLKQEVLWAVACDGKKRSDSFEMKGPCELFGFGSGDFCEGPDAKDVQSDLSGRWVSFKVNSGDELCILEPDRRLPDHIRKMDLFGKVFWYYLELVMVVFEGNLFW